MLVIARERKDEKIMDFKGRLKELRQQRGLSQSDLAKKLNISKSTISMLEVGARQPSIEMLEQIADFFNVSLDYLNGKEDGSAYYLTPETAELGHSNLTTTANIYTHIFKNPTQSSRGIAEVINNNILGLPETKK